jgi:hypothetical protein
LTVVIFELVNDFFQRIIEGGIGPGEIKLKKASSAPPTQGWVGVKPRGWNEVTTSGADFTVARFQTFPAVLANCSQFQVIHRGSA